MTRHPLIKATPEAPAVYVRVAHPHVVLDACTGSPMVRDSRVPVRRLWTWHKGGASVETLVKRYPNLGPSRVLDALSFGYDNTEIIDADIARELAALERAGERRP